MSFSQELTDSLLREFDQYVVNEINQMENDTLIACNQIRLFYSSVLIAAGPILKMPIKELVEKYGGNLDLALSSSQKSASLTCISKRIDDYNKGNKTGSLDNIVTSKSRSCQSPKSNARSQEMFWPKNVKATSYDSPKNTTPKKAKAESPGKAYVIKAPKDGEMPNYSRQRVNSNNSRAYLRKCMLSQKNI